MIRLFESHTDPDIDWVFAWFEFQNALVAREKKRVLGLLGGGNSGELWLDQEQLLGFSIQEVHAFFERQRWQLELVTMLELLATTEAMLRIDFDSRVQRRGKDNLSVRYRGIRGKRNLKVRLDEDLLGALREEGVPTGEFRGALKLRDWLAQGRYWHPKLGRLYTPDDVHEISRRLLDSLDERA